MPHVKPNRDELNANIDAVVQETTTPEPPIVETPPETTPELSPVVKTPEEPEENPQEILAPEVQPEVEPPTDNWRKRYTDSTREAQSLAFKNRELTEAIEGAAVLAEPTEEEMQKVYPDWEDMTPTEQRLTKDNFQNKRKFDLIQGATIKFKQVDDWNEKVETFVIDPKSLIAHPELEGKTDDFKLFATKPSRRNIEFEDLVLAFNGDQARNKPAPKKGQMFETGTGGAKEPEKPKDDKLSVEDSRALMTTDYKKWKDYLKAGKIRNE